MELYWLSASRGEWRGTRALQERVVSTGGSRTCPCGSHPKSCTCRGCARVSGCGWWGEEACWFTRSQISPLAEPLHKSRILPLCSLKIDKAPISVASPAVPASFPAPLWGAGLLLEETNQPGPPHKPRLSSWGCCLGSWPSEAVGLRLLAQHGAWERAGALHWLLSVADLLLFCGDISGTSCTAALLTAPLS